MNIWFLVRDTLNFQKYQNIKNLDRKVMDFFFRHIERRLSPAKKITLRDRALRVNLSLIIDLGLSFWPQYFTNLGSWSSLDLSYDVSWLSELLKPCSHRYRILILFKIQIGCHRFLRLPVASHRPWSSNLLFEQELYESPLLFETELYESPRFSHRRCTKVFFSSEIASNHVCW